MREQGVLTKLWQIIDYWLSEKGMPRFINNTVLFLLFWGFALMIYQVSGNIGKLLPILPIWQVLFAPLFCILAGIFFWHSRGEDSKIRALGMLLFFSFGLLYLYPCSGSAGFQAIQLGLNPIFIWVLFLGLSSIIANLLVKEITEHKIITSSEFLQNSFLFILLLGLSTIFHESFHCLSSNLIFSCSAGINSLTLISGSAGIGECASSSLIWIALAAPLGCFAMGLIIWFLYNKDSRIRLFALILFMLSGISQLLPIGMLDGAQAINFGAPGILVWGLFILLTGVVANLNFAEITEKEIIAQ